MRGKRRDMKSIRDIYKIGAGPSSSHTMGPERACKQMLSEYDNIKSVVANLYGSLSLTGKGHLTDYIIEKTFGEIPTTVNCCITSKSMPSACVINNTDIPK